MKDEGVDHPLSAHDSLAKTLKALEGAKKVAVGALVLVLAYNAAVVTGRIDSSLGATEWFHVLTLLLVYRLAESGARLGRHMETTP